MSDLLLITCLEIVAGIGLVYFAVPPFLQPIHLFLGTLLFGIRFYIFITYFYATKQTIAKPHVELVH